MNSKNILTLLVAASLGLSIAAPIAKADSVPVTDRAAKIEAEQAKREEIVKQRAADRKAKLEELKTKKEAKIDEREAQRTAKIERRAANKEATIQAHKDANAAKKEILQKNRDAIKASKTTATGTTN